MIRDQLTRGTSQLDVVSIVGMGGIDKTTLANKIYNDQFILSRFDICAKATVSQEYCARNVLLRLLSSASGSRKIDKSHEQQDDGQLADRLQKLLKGRRYLIFIDDIWAKEAWDDVKLYFPDCNCGSRILLTTRNMEVAENASSGKPPYQMSFLNHDESWNFLCIKVFENACFPPEFEKVGKQIVLNCKGLPLAIVMTAGLLLKIGESLDEWKSVSENITSLISTDLDVQCMRVLALSYHQLPHHLKPFFLYFAIFPEDELISVNKLVNLWEAEGFSCKQYAEQYLPMNLRVAEGFSSKEYAEQCLTDLIDRSLIFIHHLSFDGKIKACGMHDVICELFLREARNLNFVNVIIEDQNSCEQTRHFFPEIAGSVFSQSKPLLLPISWPRFTIISYIGKEWEVAEEGFPQLKFLLLNRLNIKYWRASSDQFPRLKRLFLEECMSMDSIPEDFAAITTLQLIDIRMCKESVANSANKIQQDVEDNYYGGSIEVHFRYFL
ncbi:hypothetical protein BC332_24432 [Capsicum chinense]|nr:hypothetical protein BC332_24432 [Capsicum chinense]